MEEFGERKKAFLGAILGAIGGIVGSVIPGVGTAIGAAVGGALGSVGDSAIQSNKEEEAAKEQKRTQIYQNRLAGAKSLNEAYANTEYIDDFRDRFTFGLGGNVRPNKYNDTKPAVNFQDRTPKFRIGGFVR